MYITVTSRLLSKIHSHENETFDNREEEEEEETQLLQSLTNNKKKERTNFPIATKKKRTRVK